MTQEMIESDFFFFAPRLTGVVYGESHTKDEGQKQISGKETSAMVINPVK